jgi:hypothetical protein
MSLDHGIDGPLSVRQALVRDFEPLKPRCAGCGGIGDFGEVIEDWAYGGNG